MGGSGRDRRRLRRAARGALASVRDPRLNALLDTHALLLLISGRERLGRRARDAVLNRRNRVAVSAATIWEVEIKRALGKLVAPDDLTEQLAAHGFAQLAIRWDHAVVAGRLPTHHRDPFDRMLVAQAIVEDLVVVTSDESFSRYEVRTLDALA